MVLNSALRALGLLIGLAAGFGTAFADTPEPKTFESPWHGTRDIDGVEGRDFSRLMDLYDKMKDVEAAAAAAKGCGASAEAAWKKALDDVSAAFRTALANYVADWSEGIYHPELGVNARKPTLKDIESVPIFSQDRAKVMKALASQDRKPHGAAACPAAPPPPPAGPGGKPLPDCTDAAAIDKDIAETEDELGRNKDAEEARAQPLETYRKMAEDALKLYGNDSKQYRARKADENRIQGEIDNLKIRDEELRKRLESLEKMKKECLPKEASPPPPEHSSLPPCDDGDKVAARIEGDETELAAVVEKQRGATGEGLASLRAEEASLRAELAELNSLKACPADYHPPPDAGGGPGITIGIGVGVGGGDDHHHHHGGHCDAAAARHDC